MQTNETDALLCSIEDHHDSVLLDLDLSYGVAWHPGFRLRNGSVNFDWPGWPADAS